MPVLDPTAFQILVKIIEADSGQEFLLWTNTDPSSDETADDVKGSSPDVAASGPLAGHDLAIVESVEIELNLGNNGKSTVSVAAPFDLGIKLLESSLFKIGNTMEVQIGYPRIGRFTPWFSGFMDKPAIRMSPDEGLTAQLQGNGGAFAALRSSSHKVYTGLSYLEIMEKVADRHRWTLDTRNIAADAESPLQRARESVSQQGFTDWGFIQQIARYANSDAFMAPDSDEIGRSALVVRERKRGNEQAPARTFQMRGQVDFENVFPILGFESDALGVWLPRSASLVRSQDINPDDRSVEVVEASAENAQTPALADVSPSGTGSRVVGDHQSQLVAEPRSDLDVGEHLPVSSRSPDRTPEDVIGSHREESATRGGITGTVSTFGIPEQFAGELVAVRGVGRLSGNYGVIGMTHRAQAGEWSMVLRIQSNAVASGAIASYLTIRPRSTNEEDPPEASNNDAEGGGTDTIAERTPG